MVMDDLNTRTPAALYEAFAPSEAWRIARKLEIHYIPKHGSWLNMAEIELYRAFGAGSAVPGSTHSRPPSSR
jgi:hypothetical protein